MWEVLVYDSEHENAEYGMAGGGMCAWQSVQGQYKEPILPESAQLDKWSGVFTHAFGDFQFDFMNEEELLGILNGPSELPILARRASFDTDAVISGEYTIVFDANGGEGTMDDQVVSLNTSVALSTNSFTRTNYIFNGWNTKPDGSGDSYAAGAKVYNLISGGETIVLYAQWLAPYTIHFDANGGEGTMTDQIIPTNTRVKLTANAFTKADYYFTGWNTKADGSGDSYVDGVEIYNLTTEEVVTLYAQWMYILEMQNLPTSSCATTPSRVRDNRDDHIYTIQRLKDGKCWMMENLDLGRTTLTTDLTSANTNLSTTVTASTFNGWKKTSGSQTYTAGEFINVSGTDATSGTAYGTLYNYCTASAGTICTSSNSSDASYDICPAGWRLPTGDSSGEFQALYAQYNSAALMRAPIANAGAAFALAGLFGDSTPAYQGSVGYYWSSTRSIDTRMYYLLLTTSNVSPAYNGTRYYGSSIRCLLGS